MLVEKFEAIPPAPADPIIGISDRFRADPRKEKVNLTVGNYLGADGCIPLQQTVREAESRLLHRGTVHSYLPIEGYGPYCRLLEELAFGSKSDVLTTNRVSTIQALGGTGALYVGGLFAKTALGIRHASVPNLTWGNHRALFRLGGLTVSDLQLLRQGEELSLL